MGIGRLSCFVTPRAPPPRLPIEPPTSPRRRSHQIEHSRHLADLTNAARAASAAGNTKLADQAVLEIDARLRALPTRRLGDGASRP